LARPPGSAPPYADRPHPHRRGYAAAKLGAWLDRSAWLETKDAADLALILYWYAESAEANGRLYETPAGNETLIGESDDVPLAGAHLLGTDIATTIGDARLAELLPRWRATAICWSASSSCVAVRLGRTTPNGVATSWTL